MSAQLAPTQIPSPPPSPFLPLFPSSLIKVTTEFIGKLLELVSKFFERSKSIYQALRASRTRYPRLDNDRHRNPPRQSIPHLSSSSPDLYSSSDYTHPPSSSSPIFIEVFGSSNSFYQALTTFHSQYRPLAATTLNNVKAPNSSSSSDSITIFPRGRHQPINNPHHHHYHH